MQRVQIQLIIKDLDKKMAFLAGPRQVGKTFIAKAVAETFHQPMYLNYDQVEDRKIIHDQAWLNTTDLLVLDELHKMPHWKNHLKGIYDTKLPSLRILVTGSARLEIFNRTGDSLAGRYFLHRLLPLSPAELHQLQKPSSLDTLLTRGGFPEPYLSDTEVEADRWRLQYIHSLLTTDVFDFDKIQNIGALKTIFELLRTKVGSPVSYQSLAEDVVISPSTVKKYIEILEALYIIFRITPFSHNIARSLLKEPKIYFFDTGLVRGNDGARLENLVAVCLLKHVYANIDYQAKEYALHYLKTKEGKEVDFALVKDQRIEKMIEVKLSDGKISPSLYAFRQKYHLPAVQLVKALRHERLLDGIELMTVSRFLADLYL